MEINKIIEHFTKLRETQASNDKILKADLDIYLKQSSLRIVFSLLLKENILIYDDNDEIVLELFINRENSKGMVDISDSRGYYFFKDKEITICHENILIYDDNDEIVLELFINRENSKGMVDISDSRGYYFFKDKEITICHENISYLEELIYDSIKNITKV